MLEIINAYFKQKKYTNEEHLKLKFTLPRFRPITTTQLGSASRTPLSGLLESVNSAKLLQKKYSSSEITLLMSGGVDSECMALSFLAAKIEFKAIIFCYHKYNDFDYVHAVNFLKKHQISFSFLDFDAIQFLESGKYLQWASDPFIRCRSPQFAVQMELMKTLQDRVLIMPWQPINTFYDINGLKLILPDDHFFAWARFFSKYKLRGTPFFFLYTPEQCYSFLNTPTMQSIIYTHPRSSSYLDKVNTYRDAGFKVEPRTSKATGFEKIKVFFHQRENNFSAPVFEDLFRSPMEQINPHIKNKYVEFDPRFF